MSDLQDALMAANKAGKFSGMKERKHSPKKPGKRPPVTGTMLHSEVRALLKAKHQLERHHRILEQSLRLSDKLHSIRPVNMEDVDELHALGLIGEDYKRTIPSRVAIKLLAALEAGSELRRRMANKLDVLAGHHDQHITRLGGVTL